MIAAFAMLVVALFHRVESRVEAMRVLGASLLASYSAAVLVNAVRISIAMWLALIGRAVDVQRGRRPSRRGDHGVLRGAGAALRGRPAFRPPSGRIRPGRRSAQRERPHEACVLDGLAHAFRRTACRCPRTTPSLALPLANGAADPRPLSSACSGCARRPPSLIVLIVPSRRSCMRA